MGNWNINIQGTGSHHNDKNNKDADQLAKVIVKQLIDAGHLIESATITFGGKENILDKLNQPN